MRRNAKDQSKKRKSVFKSLVINMMTVGSKILRKNPAFIRAISKSRIQIAKMSSIASKKNTSIINKKNFKSLNVSLTSQYLSSLKKKSTKTRLKMIWKIKILTAFTTNAAFTVLMKLQQISIWR